ncbi:hypothetical protein SOVF_187230 [Spinacia oleracea]|uniref:Uncharacterized protein n=1 Tax=Spinacia oleracea TaxID=3562 RepID=A0A9R0HZP7_SPIOL|nr:uncharacterized protein LOC110779817 [Spinacia oleracea]KNA05785.1 hypothetical protein SOVF_187230 [Spinacia oleracea]
MLSLSNTLNTFCSSSSISSSSSSNQTQIFKYPFQFPKTTSFSHVFSLRKSAILVPKSSEKSEVATTESEDGWLSRLPDKKKPLYSHSLPCIESWLKSLGFHQSNEDRAVWFIEKSEWRAQLSLDITELYIRYMKNGPGSLEKDMERRFSYALSREDIENAVLGGP